jgi:hypothetical protein
MVRRASHVTSLLLLAVWVGVLCAVPARAQEEPQAPAPPPTGPLVVPHAAEDTVMELVSQGQVLLIRETEPRGEGDPKDHPLAWKYFLDGLCCLLRSVGDRVLDDSRGPQYLTDHGLRVNIQRPKPHGFPVMMTFYNNARPQETAVFLIDRQDGRYFTQRIVPNPACCWTGQALRAFSEGGHDLAVLHLQGVAPVMNQYRLLWMRRGPDGWLPQREGGLELFGERVTFGLNSPSKAFPTLDVVSMENSKLFTNPPSEHITMLRSVYEVHSDSLRQLTRGMDPSSFGPSVWVMEALARGRREWALPYVSRASMLDSLAALPWAKAREGWNLERNSARFDTLLVSHPAAGRFEMYTAQVDRRLLMTGYRAAPAAKAKAKPAAAAQRPHGRKGGR